MSRTCLEILYGHKLPYHQNIVVYTIEWQKRGLPHAHILIFLHPSNKYLNLEDIDNMISTEIPNKDTHLELYELVSKHMIHGPCGLPNRRTPCMLDGKRIRFFLKKFQQATIVDNDVFQFIGKETMDIWLKRMVLNMIIKLLCHTIYISFLNIEHT